MQKLKDISVFLISLFVLFLFHFVYTYRHLVISEAPQPFDMHIVLEGGLDDRARMAIHGQTRLSYLLGL